MAGWRLLSRPLLWRQPSLSHGTFDDVVLNSFALWASKRSQVLAQRAWLNRRQLRWRTAYRALRTLVLAVEHALSLTFGREHKHSQSPIKADAER
jgi:hypothetical protein